VVALPPEFQSLEEDFVESKMAINNSIHAILDDGMSHAAKQPGGLDNKCFLCTSRIFTQCDSARAGQRR
jgi:hypothetical protein